jgi:hypothetical protein
MGTFVSCYVIVWMAVMMYVARLGIQQAHMQQSVDRLQQQIDRDPMSDETAARAA